MPELVVSMVMMEALELLLTLRPVVDSAEVVPIR
jgi:hypothetical protein